MFFTMKVMMDQTTKYRHCSYLFSLLFYCKLFTFKVNNLYLVNQHKITDDTCKSKRKMSLGLSSSDKLLDCTLATYMASFCKYCRNFQ